MVAAGNQPLNYTPTCPNVSPELGAALAALQGELRTFFCEQNSALATWTNEQFEQVNSIISGLAGGQDLQAALNTLEAIRQIVDADGNGLLDALGPLGDQMAALQSQVDAANTAATAAQTAATAAQTAAQAAQSTAQGAQTAATTAQGMVQQLVDDPGAYNIASADDLDALQDAICSDRANMVNALQTFVNDLANGMTACALPAKVFTTTNVAGGGESGDPAML